MVSSRESRKLSAIKWFYNKLNGLQTFRGDRPRDPALTVLAELIRNVQASCSEQAGLTVPEGFVQKGGYPLNHGPVICLQKEEIMAYPGASPRTGREFVKRQPDF